MFTGVLAIITPFKRGEIDFEAFDLVERQVAGGVDGIMPAAQRVNPAPLPTKRS